MVPVSRNLERELGILSPFIIFVGFRREQFYCGCGTTSESWWDVHSHSLILK
jgi:hypothetical protein